MSEPIKPALSPEEWAEVEAQRGPFAGPSRYVTSDDRCYAGCRIDDAGRHAVAAVCLHGQIEGFTHEMVESLRAVANVTLDRDPREPHANPHAAALHRAIADRIEALLPPRTPHDSQSEPSPQR